MTTTYTWDVFSSLDGFGSHHGDWGGYWGKQGPELLARRLAQYEQPQRIVFGARSFRVNTRMLAAGGGDPWVGRMKQLPATVISNTLQGPQDWPDATVAGGDAIDTIRRLKEGPTPLRSHGSLSLNRALMAAGLVDRIQLTIFPVITGKTGDAPIFAGAGDFDLELLEQRTLDGHTQELTYRPIIHR